MVDDLKTAINQRDVAFIVRQLIRVEAEPTVAAGFRRETDLWDYKVDVPHSDAASENAWANIAVDILAFHNNYGGVIIFGFDDAFRYVGATQVYDAKRFNDRLHRYISDAIWVDFSREFIRSDQRYIGVAVVGPRSARIVRFRSDAPALAKGKLFCVGWSAIRQNDSTRILDKEQSDEFARRANTPTLFDIYAVDEPRYRILTPDYTQFVAREKPCTEILRALTATRVATTSVLGIGGVGKTALATWAILTAYDKKQFQYIVSTTAKDRELTGNIGITPLLPELTNVDSLFDTILDVIGLK